MYWDSCSCINFYKQDEKDTEFKATEDEKDEEDTIAEQEKHEKKIDYSKELHDLKDESKHCCSLD